MNTRLVLTGLLAAILVCTTARAWGDDPKQDEKDAVAEAMNKLVQLGQGVHKIKTDKQGRITSCVVVGESRISTVLGAAKGEETAKTRSRLAAEAEFVKWLKTKVEVRQKSEDETVMFLEGSEGNNGNTLAESGKAIEKTSSTFESVAQGLVRGLQLIHAEITSVNDKEKKLVLIFGWDAKTAAATKKVANDLANDKPDSGKGKGKAPANKPDGNDGDERRKIEDKKVTSSDAKKFLD